MAGLTKYVLLFLSSQLCCLSSFVFVVVVNFYFRLHFVKGKGCCKGTTFVGQGTSAALQYIQCYSH